MCVPLGFRPDLARFASGKATSVKSALAGRLSKMHGGAKFNKVHNKAVALKDGTLVRRHSRAAVAPARLACLGTSPHGHTLSVPHGHTCACAQAARAKINLKAKNIKSMGASWVDRQLLKQSASAAEGGFHSFLGMLEVRRRPADRSSARGSRRAHRACCALGPGSSVLSCRAVRRHTQVHVEACCGLKPNSSFQVRPRGQTSPMRALLGWPLVCQLYSRMVVELS